MMKYSNSRAELEGSHLRSLPLKHLDIQYKFSDTTQEKSSPQMMSQEQAARTE